MTEKARVCKQSWLLKGPWWPFGDVVSLWCHTVVTVVEGYVVRSVSTYIFNFEVAVKPET